MSQPKVEIPLEIKDDTDGVSKSIVGTLVNFTLTQFSLPI